MMYNRIMKNKHLFKKGKNIMNRNTKLISCAAAMVLTISAGISASAFSDMPEGEMGQALQNAVDAKLIEGIDNDHIAPYDSITRAQMATIITRAFSATEKATSKFNDVSDGAWYADSVSKAVAMGAFEGDDNNNFRPENNITFQETYLVLSRIFGFQPYLTTSGVMVGDCGAEVLDKFADKDSIDSWAVDGARYIVGNGGWTGIDSKLKPKDNITRGEFAVLMDAIVDMYIDEPGTYSELTDGLIMVRSGDVTIDGLKSNHNLILTYGIDEKGCTVKNSTVNGVTLVLGGIDLTPAEIESSNGTKRFTPDDAYISLNGNFYDVRISTPYVFVDASDSNVEYVWGVKHARISLSSNT